MEIVDIKLTLREILLNGKSAMRANVKLLKDGVSQGYVEWDVTGKADLVNPNSIHFTGIGAITVRAKIIGNKEDTIIQGYFDVKK